MSDTSFISQAFTFHPFQGCKKHDISYWSSPVKWQPRRCARSRSLPVTRAAIDGRSSERSPSSSSDDSPFSGSRSSWELETTPGGQQDEAQRPTQSWSAPVPKTADDDERWRPNTPPQHTRVSQAQRKQKPARPEHRGARAAAAGTALAMLRGLAAIAARFVADVAAPAAEVARMAWGDAKARLTAAPPRPGESAYFLPIARGDGEREGRVRAGAVDEIWRGREEWAEDTASELSDEERQIDMVREVAEQTIDAIGSGAKRTWQTVTKALADEAEGEDYPSESLPNDPRLQSHNRFPTRRAGASAASNCPSRAVTRLGAHAALAGRVRGCAAAVGTPAWTWRAPVGNGVTGPTSRALTTVCFAGAHFLGVPLNCGPSYISTRHALPVPQLRIRCRGLPPVLGIHPYCVSSSRSDASRPHRIISQHGLSVSRLIACALLNAQGRISVLDSGEPRPTGRRWQRQVLAALIAFAVFVLRPLSARAVAVRSSGTGVTGLTASAMSNGGAISAPGVAVSAAKTELQRGLVVAACAMFVVGAALAAAETAITTLWPWKVRELAEKEGERSPFAILEKDLTRFLTTILVATTSATVFSTAVATELAGVIFGDTSVAYVTAGMTVFFLFFGEILPKTIAVHAPAKVARLMVPVISLLSTIVYPMGKVLASISTMILRLFKLPMESDATVSEEELRLIVAGADRSGSIEKYESQIIKNVLDLEETPVRAVMCPRVDMVALGATCTLTELLQEEAKSHYSRMPVYDASIDNIIGVVFAKSLLRYLDEGSEALNRTNVAEIMDPAFFVPESMSVWIALEQMRKRRLHMAVVVDEYGGTAGLVTLEDILEEVVGEIYDEDDEFEAEAQDIRPAGEGCFVIDGQAELEKVGERLVMELTEDDLRDYGTISGFLCARMGGIPEVGDLIVFDRIRFTVTEADDRRIRSVRTELLTDEEVEELRRISASEVDENGDPGELAPPSVSTNGSSNGSDHEARDEGSSGLRTDLVWMRNSQSNGTANHNAPKAEAKDDNSMLDGNGASGFPVFGSEVSPENSGWSSESRTEEISGNGGSKNSSIQSPPSSDD